MTFLQLCQRVFTEGGISGQISSTQNQTGEALRVVGWVQTAYQELLNDQGIAWDFLRKSATKQLTAGKGDYTFAELGITDGVEWDTRSLRVALSADLSDEAHVDPLDYASFRDTWLFGANRTLTGQPQFATIDPAGKLRLAPIPASAYWLDGEYQAMPTLVEDADTPVFDSRYHLAVMWGALRHYGMFDGAPEVVVRGDVGLKSIMLQLQTSSSPEVVIGEPLC